MGRNPARPIRSLLAAGFHTRTGRQIRWQLVRFERLDIHLDQAHERAAEIRPAAAAAIDNDADRLDDSTMRAHDVDRFLDAPPACDHIFRDDEALARRDLKPAPQHQPSGVFLREDMAFTERAAYFLSYDDAAEGRGYHRVAFDAAQLLRQAPANISCDAGVLEQQRALEELAAVQAGAQDEMPVEQRAGLPEEREEGVHGKG